MSHVTPCPTGIHAPAICYKNNDLHRITHNHIQHRLSPQSESILILNGIHVVPIGTLVVYGCMQAAMRVSALPAQKQDSRFL